MSNVVPFPKTKSTATERPAGILDIFESQHGMFLLDGCLPDAVKPAIRALMETAGVLVRENVADVTQR